MNCSQCQVVQFHREWHRFKSDTAIMINEPLFRPLFCILFNVQLTLSVLTAMVTLYLFQIASYTSPYCPPPSLCFITMSVLGSRELFIFHLNMPSLSWGVKNFLSFILNMPSLSWGVKNFYLSSSICHRCFHLVVTNAISV